MSTTSDARSDDFLRIADQFKLGALVTEGSHPVTANLSDTAAADTAAALRLLFDVDDDVVRAYRAFVESGRATAIAAEVAGRLRRGGRSLLHGLRIHGPAQHPARVDLARLLAAPACPRPGVRATSRRVGGPRLQRDGRRRLRPHQVR